MASPWLSFPPLLFPLLLHSTNTRLLPADLSTGRFTDLSADGSPTPVVEHMKTSLLPYLPPELSFLASSLDLPAFSLGSYLALQQHYVDTEGGQPLSSQLWSLGLLLFQLVFSPDSPPLLLGQPTVSLPPPTEPVLPPAYRPDGAAVDGAQERAYEHYLYEGFSEGEHAFLAGLLRVNGRERKALAVDFEVNRKTAQKEGKEEEEKEDRGRYAHTHASVGAARKEEATEAASIASFQRFLSELPQLQDEFSLQELEVSIPRKRIVSTLLKVLSHWQAPQLLSPLVILYKGELGDDAGGLKRDVFHQFFSFCVSPLYHMFESSSGGSYGSSSSSSSSSSGNSSGSGGGHSSSSSTVFYLPPQQALPASLFPEQQGSPPHSSGPSNSSNRSAFEDLTTYRQYESVGKWLLKALVEGVLVPPVFPPVFYEYLMTPPDEDGAPDSSGTGTGGRGVRILTPLPFPSLKDLFLFDPELATNLQVFSSLFLSRSRGRSCPTSYPMLCTRPLSWRLQSRKTMRRTWS